MTLGKFDAYVQDEQEKSAHQEYAEYVEYCFHIDQLPKSFEDFFHDKPSRDSVTKENV